MALPPADSVPPFAVYYQNGNINYSDGTNWIPILTAGSFTQVVANGNESPLTLGTWAATVTDHANFLSNLQTNVNTLTTQMATLQSVVNSIKSQINTIQNNILQNIMRFLKSQ